MIIFLDYSLKNKKNHYFDNRFSNFIILDHCLILRCPGMNIENFSPCVNFLKIIFDINCASTYFYLQFFFYIEICLGRTMLVVLLRYNLRRLIN